MRAATVCVLLIAALAARANADEPPVRAIDAAKSRAAFSVRHIFVERVTGTIPIAGGSVVLSPDSALPQSVSAQLAPGGVNSGERDRDASLASADFFDIKAFGVWTFVSTQIVAIDATHCTIDGNLTVHGVTQPVRLDVVVRGDALHPVYHAVARIDRRRFGMAVTRLDPVIGSDVAVTLEVTLK